MSDLGLASPVSICCDDDAIHAMPSSPAVVCKAKSRGVILQGLTIQSESWTESEMVVGETAIKGQRTDMHAI